MLEVWKSEQGRTSFNLTQANWTDFGYKGSLDAEIYLPQAELVHNMGIFQEMWLLFEEWVAAMTRRALCINLSSIPIMSFPGLKNITKDHSCPDCLLHELLQWNST